MRETIGQVAGGVSLVALAVSMVALTIAAVAKDNTIRAAIASPIALLTVLMVMDWINEPGGWFDLK